jgi:hypothetical protein
VLCAQAKSRGITRFSEVFFVLVPDGNSHALSIYEIYVGLESVGSLVREQL